MATVAQPVATDIDTLCINTIRTLSIDAIQKANSGHPGTPMAMAPVAYTLWQRFLRFDPTDPIWPNRDRFVLSAGHASMLLYSLLHLAKVEAVDPDYEVLGEPSVSMDDIKSFRQLDSHCPGHPEYHLTSGVETTTGPLGQGIATSVGMAVAGKWLQARYGSQIYDFDTYAIAGDGCLMEGVSNEAASLAGHQRLDNLCWIYDNNHITIDGHTEITYEDDVAARFMGYRWNVTRVGDANDLELLTRAFQEFKEEKDRPTLIIVDSHIGYGSPHKQDTAEAHGEPLGEEEVRETKRTYGWPEDAQFLVPDGVYEHFARGVGERGRRLRTEWEQRVVRRRPAGRHRDRPDAAPGPARRLGCRPPELRARREGPGDPQGLQPGAERDRRAGALAHQRLRRPHGLRRERPGFRGRGLGGVPAGGPQGPRPPPGDPRTRVGRTLQRARAQQAPARVVDVPDLLRLRASRDPPLVPDGAPRDPLVQPRLDRARRGRSQPISRSSSSPRCARFRA